MSKARYLLDVNVLIALLSEDHIHHQIVTSWFSTPHLQWAICPFTEAGFIRVSTAPRPGSITMRKATEVLAALAELPGYHYQPIDTDWRTLTGPFSARLYGTKQVTDAYLLGLAVWHSLFLVTLHQGIVHLAGKEHGKYVHLLPQD